MTHQFGLGRLPAEDERDRRFSIAPLLQVPDRTYRYWWANGWWGNQAATSHCVDYSWHHLIADGPVTYDKDSPLWTPGSVYFEAQKVDEWPGENYDGTSVRAGAKVLQQLGIISEYRWAFNLGEVVTAILTTAPVVFGSTWYENMFFPDNKGRISIGGPVAGGHAYVFNGVNTKTRMLRIKNSWGRGWGNNGHAYISFEDAKRLFEENAEACIPVENPLAF